MFDVSTVFTINHYLLSNPKKDSRLVTGISVLLFFPESAKDKQRVLYCLHCLHCGLHGLQESHESQGKEDQVEPVLLDKGRKAV